jgi:hypothetical protein
MQYDPYWCCWRPHPSLTKQQFADHLQKMAWTNKIGWEESEEVDIEDNSSEQVIEPQQDSEEDKNAEDVFEFNGDEEPPRKEVLKSKPKSKRRKIEEVDSDFENEGWICGACSISNPIHAVSCEACGAVNKELSTRSQRRRKVPHFIVILTCDSQE